MTKKKFFLMGFIILLFLIVIMFSFFLYRYWTMGKLVDAISQNDQAAFDKRLPLVMDLNALPYPSALYAFAQENGRTPLQKACEVGNLYMVTRLVEEGADVNATSNRAPFSPLMFAVMSESEANLDIVQFLIQNGADVTYRKKDGKDALYQLAIARGSVPHTEAILDLLVQNGGKLSYAYNRGTLLNEAAFAGNKKVISHLLTTYEMDCNVGASQRTALIHYCLSYRPTIETIQLFLDCGADKTRIDEDGKTAYDYAVERGYTDVAELLK